MLGLFVGQPVHIRQVLRDSAGNKVAQIVIRGVLEKSQHERFIVKVGETFIDFKESCVVDDDSMKDVFGCQIIELEDGVIG